VRVGAAGKRGKETLTYFSSAADSTYAEDAEPHAEETKQSAEEPRRAAAEKSRSLTVEGKREIRQPVRTKKT